MRGSFMDNVRPVLAEWKRTVSFCILQNVRRRSRSIGLDCVYVCGYVTSGATSSRNAFGRLLQHSLNKTFPSSFRQPLSVHSPLGSPHPADITSSQSPPLLLSPITHSPFRTRLKKLISFTNYFLHSLSVSSGLPPSSTFTKQSGHWRLFCFSYVLVFYILFLSTCARLSWSHSASESMLNSPMVLDRIELNISSSNSISCGRAAGRSNCMECSAARGELTLLINITEEWRRMELDWQDADQQFANTCCRSIASWDHGGLMKPGPSAASHSTLMHRSAVPVPYRTYDPYTLPATPLTLNKWRVITEQLACHNAAGRRLQMRLKTTPNSQYITRVCVARTNYSESDNRATLLTDSLAALKQISTLSFDFRHLSGYAVS